MDLLKTIKKSEKKMLRRKREFMNFWIKKIIYIYYGFVGDLFNQRFERQKDGNLGRFIRFYPIYLLLKTI